MRDVERDRVESHKENREWRTTKRIESRERHTERQRERVESR